ncbi:ufm1-specific protease 2-like [Heptranchias perlo]|uniref:ufm1-specific protease 2-like n=1 Tax=Heptranchias perlo TaxID=212740 RepID=UPI00355A2C37
MLPLDSEDLLFRIKGGFQLEGMLSKTDESDIKAGLSEAFKDLISKVNSHAFILNGLGGSLYLWPKSHASTSPSELHDDARCKSILKFVTIEVNDSLKRIPKKKSLKITPLKVVNLQMLLEVTRPDVIENVIVHCETKSRLHFRLNLPIDVVVFAKPEDPWGKLQDQFVEAVSSQLSEMEKCIQKYTKGQSVPVPQAFHFELPEKTTLTTVVYPAGISDETLEPQRKELHTELGLGDKPFFRRSMVYQFPNDEINHKYRRTIHKYIPLPNPEDFKIGIAHGSYSYHHYLQDGVNDIEWGSAYRGLQTIISWYKYQGYIDKPIPTHEDFQKMMVNVGEEFVNVVGVTDPIGPFEIESVLTHAGISSNIMNIRPNNQVHMEANELVAHFHQQGTPIIMYVEPMSYVILGVAVNEETKEMKFLVLNVLYTGDDDWSNVIEKGVEWKSLEFWDQREPYDICLPQRPEGV